jgi:hypothetical protein
MKTIKKIIFTIAFSILCFNNVLFAQDVSVIKQYESLLENQKQPLLSSDEELMMIDGTVWSRNYGETEYVLTPTVVNKAKYRARIKSLDNKTLNVIKSNFRFVNVPINSLTKPLLETFGIKVPSYVKDRVNVFLPQIDIDLLLSAGSDIVSLNEYGKKVKTQNLQPKNEPTAVIYSEGFETATVPGPSYSTFNNASVNCGWSDESCYKHSGSWSVWCSGNGAACNACGNDYVNNMDSDFEKTNDINTSSYQNLTFTWWMDYDFNNTGTNDVLYVFWWDGTNYILSPTSYNSSSQYDGALWKQHTATFSGPWSVINFDFNFVSNSFGTSYGVYIDDIQLSGTAIANGLAEVEDNKLKLNIYPNPNNGKFILSTNEDIQLSISNELGQVVKLIELNQTNKHQVEIADLANGIYFVTGITNKTFVKEKIVINK